MELKDIRSRNDFIEFLKHWDEVPIEDCDLGEVADWFVVMQNAHGVFSSFSTKDLAKMFLTGVEGLQNDPEKYHRVFWGTIFEDVDASRKYHDAKTADIHEEEAVEMIKTMLDRHFGIQ